MTRPYPRRVRPTELQLRGGVGLLASCARIACLMGVSAFWCFVACAQQPKPTPYQIEATYLYNFSRFVAWPSDASPSKTQSFEICVLGSDPFGPVLDSILSGETVGGRNLIAKRISKAEEASDCQILFISMSEEGRLKEILTAVNGSSVLTVSDIAGFSQRGGMIQFVLDGGKVRFAVNLKRASNAKLTLSADLLKVAATVLRDPQSGQ